jgi:hypothetical protein
MELSSLPSSPLLFKKKTYFLLSSVPSFKFQPLDARGNPVPPGTTG